MDGLNGAGFVWDCRIVEREEDRIKEGRCLIIGSGLKLFVDVDDESRANSRKQARLQDKVRS